MKETPIHTGEAAPEQPSMTMSEFAQRHDHGYLKTYIEKALDTYANMELSPENFIYYEATEEMPAQVCVTLMPSEIHTGHAGIVHGGIITFLADASAGSLAMTLTDGIAKTKKSTTEFLNEAVLGKPLHAISYIQPDTSVTTGRTVEVHTRHMQDGSTVAKSVSTMRLTKKAVLERIALTQSQATQKEE